MAHDQKPTNPSQHDPEEGNDMDPRRKEPVSPGQYRSGIDEPGTPTRKNPGHTNPAHNTPGHIRQNQPDQAKLKQPGLEQSQSYPGIMGRKARALKEDN